MPLSLFSSALSRQFAQMGSRIVERHRRCEGWWAPHLKNTADFISQHLPSGARVAVLGAGRLLDIDAASLISRNDEVHLFDADESCLRAWRSGLGSDLRRRIVPRIEDVTCCLSDWQALVRDCKSVASLERQLAALRAPLPAWASEEFDAIVSLNLLGQIPLYWRDVVRARLAGLSEPQEEALAASMGELQRAHLEGLARSTADRVIVVTDSEYYFYEASTVEWRVEAALFGSARTLLQSPGVEGRAVIGKDTWLWHLAPQFIEHNDEGEIHKVEAIAWGR